MRLRSPRFVAGFETSRLVLTWLLVLACLPIGLCAASVTGISPALGHPGDVIQVNGSGFDTNPSNNVVRFGPNRAPVFSATAVQLIVQVPNGQPLGPTVVSVNG